MENLKPLEEDKQKEAPEDGSEAKKPMPFGIMGITFLVNVTQYAVFVGLTVAILALIRIFGPK